MRTIAAHRKDVHGLAFAPDGRTLASVGGHSAAVWVWDASSGELVGKLPGRRDRGRSVAFSPDGKLIAAADNRNLVRVWRLPDGRPEAEIVVSQWYTPAYAVVFLPDGRSVVTASEEVRVWELGRFHPPYRQAPAAARERIDAVAPSADGAILAIGSGKAVGCWWLRTDLYCHMADVAARVHSLAFSPDGSSLAAAFGHMVQVLGLPNGEPRQTLDGHDGMVWQVAYTPDGARLVTASSDGTVGFWDAGTGARRGSFDWQTGKVRCVAVSPDGLTVASGGQDGRIIVADLDP
jgi:WD40 repeat protein